MRRRDGREGQAIPGDGVEHEDPGAHGSGTDAATGSADPPDAPGAATREAVPTRSPAESALRGLPSRRAGAAARVARTQELDEAALALAHRIVELASDKKASDIVLLDVRAQTSMADYFVICSGASDRQLAAIRDGIVEGAKAAGVSPIGREGEAGSRWLLLDYGAVIVHVMSGPEREFYQLEKLWSDASLLLHVL